MKPVLISAVVTVVASLVVPGMSVRAQEPTLEDVLARATQYALDYQEALSGVVSEESYLQTWQRGSRDPQVRELKSDVLLIRRPGKTQYVLFRDVFEVDGREVRDRDERLQQLFLSPSEANSAQILRILDESARYNLGDIGRTVNTPTLALVFLDAQYQSRFRFERVDDRVAESVRDPSVDSEQVRRFTGTEDLWVVAYTEIGRNTLIGNSRGGALPASGRFWIDPETGRIVITELRLRDETVDAVIDVRYELEPSVGLIVPTAMRERYHDLRRDSVIEGTADYSRVRRFQVTSTEDVKEPAQ